MSTLKTPFRYDFVGSFLRPQILKDSKKKLKNGEIQKDEYDKIVNEEITKLVAKQKNLVSTQSQTASSEELSGTLILCGDLRALSMRTRETELSLMRNLQNLTIHIWLVKSRQRHIRLLNTLNF